MKKSKNYILALFSFILLTFGGFLYLPSFSVNASSYSFSGDIVNNVIYVAFNDSDAEYLNKTETNYSQSVKDVIDFSYNDSVSSVKNYYKAQSFNKLNLYSNFYYSNNKAYITCYSEDQLKKYSKTNPEGYLDYEVCSYTSNTAPGFLSQNYILYTDHLFSCYDCGCSAHDGSLSSCDLSWGGDDDVACLCAYYKYKAANPSAKIKYYDHLEKEFREQIALKSVLSQLSSFSGDIDKNSDGKIDALTFIFPSASDVHWGDLLWAHQAELVNLSSYLPKNLCTSSTFSMLATRHNVRGANETQFEMLFNDNKINSKVAKDYNLYLLSDIMPSSPIKDTDNNEIVKTPALAHELGHVLGLPDYYNYEDANDKPVYYYDLMAYTNTNYPLYLTTYDREILNFTNPNNTFKLTHCGEYELKPTCYDEVYNDNVNSNNILAFLYEDENYPDQKIYFEYRAKIGSFESGAPKGRKDGLLIYRIDKGVKQVYGFSDMLSQGNFYGDPYNMYVFRSGAGIAIKYVLNDTNNSFNNITFQNYDSSRNQSSLTKSDVTFTNSGLSVTNVKIEDGVLRFTISGGNLQEEKDLSTIKLKGETNITQDVKTKYTDAGFEFGNGGYTADDFIISTTDLVNENINNLGTYTYNYRLVLKLNSSIIVNLTRTVQIVDTICPTISLLGKENITIVDLTKYTECGVIYSDNYFDHDNLILSISQIKHISDNKYKIAYTVTENRLNGLSSTVYRYINILSSTTDFSSITLKGINVINHTVNTNYTDSGISFGSIYNEDQFIINVNDNVTKNIASLGKFEYTYCLTYKETCEDYYLTRYVNIIDDIAPSISLLGESEIIVPLNNISGYSDNDISVSDNYDVLIDIIVTTRLVKINDEEYRYCYKATDKSGNTSDEIYRTLKIQYKSVEEKQISIVIENDLELYTTLKVNFSVFISFNNDNNKNETFRIAIFENNNSIFYTSEKEFDYKFLRSGIYDVKVYYGDTVKERHIFVKDISEKPIDKTSLIRGTFFVIISLFIISLIVIISKRIKARNITKNLDKY